MPWLAAIGAALGAAGSAAGGAAGAAGAAAGTAAAGAGAAAGTAAAGAGAAAAGAGAAGAAAAGAGAAGAAAAGTAAAGATAAGAGAAGTAAAGAAGAAAAGASTTGAAMAGAGAAHALGGVAGATGASASTSTIPAMSMASGGVGNAAGQPLAATSGVTSGATGTGATVGQSQSLLGNLLGGNNQTLLGNLLKSRGINTGGNGYNQLSQLLQGGGQGQQGGGMGNQQGIAQMQSSRNQLQSFFNSHTTIPHYANGGIAGLNGPEVAQVGENGPEAIIPLNNNSDLAPKGTGIGAADFTPVLQWLQSLGSNGQQSNEQIAQNDADVEAKHQKLLADVIKNNPITSGAYKAVKDHIENSVPAAIASGVPYADIIDSAHKMAGIPNPNSQDPQKLITTLAAMASTMQNGNGNSNGNNSNNTQSMGLNPPRNAMSQWGYDKNGNVNEAGWAIRGIQGLAQNGIPGLLGGLAGPNLEQVTAGAKAGQLLAAGQPENIALPQAQTALSKKQTEMLEYGKKNLTAEQKATTGAAGYTAQSELLDKEEERINQAQKNLTDTFNAQLGARDFVSKNLSATSLLDQYKTQLNDLQKQKEQLQNKRIQLFGNHPNFKSNNNTKDNPHTPEQIAAYNKARASGLSQEAARKKAGI